MKPNHYYIVVMDLLLVTGIFAGEPVCEPAVDIHRYNHGVNEIITNIKADNAQLNDRISLIVDRMNKLTSELTLIKKVVETTKTCECGYDMNSTIAAIKKAVNHTPNELDGDFGTLKKSSSRLPTVKLGKNKYYFGKHPRKSWYRANTFCEENGLELAKIENVVENQLITEYFLNIAEIRDNWRGMWIGATDFDSDGQFHWMKDNELIVITREWNPWRAQRPFNTEGDQCVSTYSTLWIADDCMLEKYFLCKL